MIHLVAVPFLIKPERMVVASRILGLANKAYFLYLKQSQVEKSNLLNLVVSNWAIEPERIYATWRKPFHLIFLRVKIRRTISAIHSQAVS